uniref:Uncharacterized protein n=1 Tax=Oryza barthii TaxID=65489 RepID=A0A0D3ERG3_9ORYZ
MSISIKNDVNDNCDRNCNGGNGNGSTGNDNINTTTSESRAFCGRAFQEASVSFAESDMAPNFISFADPVFDSGELKTPPLPVSPPAAVFFRQGGGEGRSLSSAGNACAIRRG